MASLNLSINGPSIKSSYNGVVSSPPPTSGSPTYAQWALFSVQAPLMSAFQDSGAKESILKVESTGDGELTDLIEDFNEGRIQFAFVKVKDPNTSLPKNILIAWCGGGVPERTKGYFTSHTAAVAKVLHGYHVQITARSDSDLEPESIMKKVSDASGAKYSAGNPGGTASSAPPPVKSKPVFTPTASSSGRSANPLVAARSRRDEHVDEEGWGADAPPVTRTQIEKVESAYKPTKVNMAELTKQKQEPSRFGGGGRQDEEAGDVVRGGYQPVGKVDIAAIRAAAKNKGDDRPTPVKGSYEPVGKVDIAAIRAKAQKPADEPTEDAPAPKPVADRAAAFSQPSQSERITSLPKPKVANKFGGASSFTGTKAPTPGALGFGSGAAPAPAPVTSTSRTFADQGGKTPAQLWAEKKARERGGDVGGAAGPSTTAPITSQTSGGNEWKSGYKGKSWAPVQTSGYSRGGPDDVSQHNTGEATRSAEEEPTATPISALRDRFKDTTPIGAAAIPPVSRAADDEPEPQPEEREPTPPPPPPASSRPSGGFALPGLPNRPPPPAEDEDEEENFRADEREYSPIRVAAPVGRGAEPEPEPESPLAPPPVRPSDIDVPKEEELPEQEESSHLARGAASAVAQETFQHEHGTVEQTEQGGKRAVIQYDYDKAEDNEIDLVEGEYVTNIDMVDEDWWMGTNSRGESGLFPSNYVELVEDDSAEAAAPPPPAAVPTHAAAPAAPEPASEPAPSAGAGATATALYDYEAAEDNELSFPEDAKVTNLEFPDEDWWFGHFNGQAGLFPANYVQLDS
ncbi:actin binding protein [Purpureocillium lavendulum]|uniref:Actin binding protein n=1 Tax=Purpureocillium lavendulum TaxID=1247861 RepID=A0AB34G3I7_9HYPO|nr:actin binding protein [Purpureocillium lavendulum]